MITWNKSSSMYFKLLTHKAGFRRPFRVFSICRVRLTSSVRSTCHGNPLEWGDCDRVNWPDHVAKHTTRTQSMLSIRWLSLKAQYRHGRRICRAIIKNSQARWCGVDLSDMHDFQMSASEMRPMKTEWIYSDYKSISWHNSSFKYCM